MEITLKTYSIPVNLIVYAENASDAIAVAVEELNYLARCDNEVIAFNLSDDPATVTQEES